MKEKVEGFESDSSEDQDIELMIETTRKNKHSADQKGHWLRGRWGEHYHQIASLLIGESRCGPILIPVEEARRIRRTMPRYTRDGRN